MMISSLEYNAGTEWHYKNGFFQLVRCLPMESKIREVKWLQLSMVRCKNVWKPQLIMMEGEEIQDATSSLKEDLPEL